MKKILGGRGDRMAKREVRVKGEKIGVSGKVVRNYAVIGKGIKEGDSSL